MSCARTPNGRKVKRRYFDVLVIDPSRNDSISANGHGVTCRVHGAQPDCPSCIHVYSYTFERSSANTHQETTKHKLST
eukprot:697478-Hanusia_phi.AAC.3